VLFAVSFFGAFEMVLPSSWTNKQMLKRIHFRNLSIFFMALPWLGFVLLYRTDYRYVAGAGCIYGSIVAPRRMFGFAFALAIPFSVLPSSPYASDMPKSGGWLNSVKVVLAFWSLRWH
jgi:thiol:disulfide interchange protein DsbD